MGRTFLSKYIFYCVLTCDLIRDVTLISMFSKKTKKMEFMYIDQQFDSWWYHDGKDWTWAHGNCLQKCPANCRQDANVVFHYVARSTQDKHGWYCSNWDWKVWMTLSTIMWGGAITIIPFSLTLLFFCFTCKNWPGDLFLRHKKKKALEKAKKDKEAK